MISEASFLRIFQGEIRFFQKTCSPFYPHGCLCPGPPRFSCCSWNVPRSSPPQGLHTDGPEKCSRLSLLANSYTSHRPQLKYHLCGEEVSLNSAPVKCSQSTLYFSFPAHNHNLQLYVYFVIICLTLVFSITGKLQEGRSRPPLSTRKPSVAPGSVNPRWWTGALSLCSRCPAPGRLPDT